MAGNMRPILLVDDDDVDMMIVKRALKALQVPNKMIYKPDGLAAWEYLKEEGSEMPSMLFLDLNMPRMNGWELLENIMEDDGLKNIPIVILTTSDNPDDIKKAGGLMPPVVNYIVKPPDYKRTVEKLGKQLVDLDIIDSIDVAVA
ncbi:MAG: response regulator [Sedimentisphaerales bacterium]|nr:response regulator [Sedimentisphaerales bacterium]